MSTYSQLVEDVRAVYRSGRTQSLSWRRAQLEAIIRMLEEQKEAFIEVIHQDLRKPRVESCLTEIGPAMDEAAGALNKLDEWTSPQKVKKNLLLMMDTCYIRSEPLGVILIMGAWNYPLQLTVHPLIGAIAAGNCVIIKPSEVCSAFSNLLEKILPQYVDPEAVRVVNGAVTETTTLLREQFDHILYTGSSNVGKVVMAAAAKHLTPVTLELGGKSPCYVDATSDLHVVARRLLWGRLLNNGQTCIAPDYVLCQHQVQEKLLVKMDETLKYFYGEDPQKSDDLSRIVNERHFHRVKSLMDSGRVAIGGQTDEATKYIAPTIIVDVKPTDPIMTDEVFGPVMAIMNVNSPDEAIEFINSREKPLALYVFSQSQAVADQFLTRTSSGSFLVNDCLMQSSLDTLPFGGVGNSGMGAYHGKFSFDTFSHRKAVMIRKQAMEKVNDIRYPPYSLKKLSFLRSVLRKNVNRTGFFGRIFPFVLMGVALAFILKFVGLEKYTPKFLKNN